jgi:hypothetical protein
MAGRRLQDAHKWGDGAGEAPTGGSAYVRERGSRGDERVWLGEGIRSSVVHQAKLSRRAWPVLAGGRGRYPWPTCALFAGGNGRPILGLTAHHIPGTCCPNSPAISELAPAPPNKFAGGNTRRAWKALPPAILVQICQR